MRQKRNKKKKEYLNHSMTWFGLCTSPALRVQNSPTLNTSSYKLISTHRRETTSSSSSSFTLSLFHHLILILRPANQPTNKRNHTTKHIYLQIPPFQIPNLSIFLQIFRQNFFVEFLIHIVLVCFIFHMTVESTEYRKIKKIRDNIYTLPFKTNICYILLLLY